MSTSTENRAQRAATTTSTRPCGSGRRWSASCSCSTRSSWTGCSSRATRSPAPAALIGAVILGYPIVWTAIKDIRSGVLSINELVAIAVLAAFATGDYKTAGVVAFFMLMGEIIETRTAEGARASIESPHQAHAHQGAPHHAARRGGSRRQGPGDWRRDPHPPRRQRGGGRRHSSAARARSTRPRSPANRCRWTRSRATKSSPARRT